VSFSQDSAKKYFIHRKTVKVYNEIQERVAFAFNCDGNGNCYSFEENARDAVALQLKFRRDKLIGCRLQLISDLGDNHAGCFEITDIEKSQLIRNWDF